MSQPPHTLAFLYRVALVTLTGAICTTLLRPFIPQPEYALLGIYKPKGIAIVFNPATGLVEVTPLPGAIHE